MPSEPKTDRPTGTIFELDIFREKLERRADSVEGSTTTNVSEPYGEVQTGDRMAEELRGIAAELKTLIDNCMKQYGPPSKEPGPDVDYAIRRAIHRAQDYAALPIERTPDSTDARIRLTLALNGLADIAPEIARRDDAVSTPTPSPPTPPTGDCDACGKTFAADDLTFRAYGEGGNHVADGSFCPDCNGTPLDPPPTEGGAEGPYDHGDEIELVREDGTTFKHSLHGNITKIANAAYAAGASTRAEKIEINLCEGCNPLTPHELHALYSITGDHPAADEVVASARKKLSHTLMGLPEGAVSDEYKDYWVADHFASTRGSGEAVFVHAGTPESEALCFSGDHFAAHHIGGTTWRFGSGDEARDDQIGTITLAPRGHTEYGFGNARWIVHALDTVYGRNPSRGSDGLRDRFSKLAIAADRFFDELTRKERMEMSGKSLWNLRVLGTELKSFTACLEAATQKQGE